MSSTDKQIRELTPMIFAEVCDVCKSYYGMSVDEVLSKAVAFSVAMKVTESGYRKQSEVAREIFDLIEDECLAYPMQDGDVTILVDKRNYDELKKKCTEGE